MSLDQDAHVIPELDHWDTASRREQVLGYRMEHLVSKDNVNAVRSRHPAASAGQGHAFRVADWRLSIKVDA